MGYTKVKNMSIKKDGTITITAASSNVTPKRYVTEEIRWQKDYSFSEKLRAIFDDLMGGMLQFNESSTSKVFYAYLKAITEFRRKYEHLSIRDLWWSKYDEAPKLTEQESKDLTEELFEDFQVYLMDGQKMTSKRYAVKLPNETWLKKVYKWRYRFSAEPRYFAINQALLYAMKYDGEIVEKEN